MEAPNLLENGNIPQQRKFTCCQVAFYTLIFVLIMISALVPVGFCLLRHKQAPELCWAHGSLKNSTQDLKGPMSWEWNLKHCNGFVQKDHDKYLVIEQRGNYFIYAQVNRIKNMTEVFTLMLYKEPEILLNKVVGPNEGDGRGTINFGRPFFLQKGDKLYCKALAICCASWDDEHHLHITGRSQDISKVLLEKQAAMAAGQPSCPMAWSLSLA